MVDSHTCTMISCERRRLFPDRVIYTIPRWLGRYYYLYSLLLYRHHYPSTIIGHSLPRTCPVCKKITIYIRTGWMLSFLSSPSLPRQNHHHPRCPSWFESQGKPRRDVLDITLLWKLQFFGHLYSILTQVISTLY